ncbi:SMP-30/gluconolactonase/LRE family protein [Pseudomonas turukhanskensis]|uniref:SMP-30/Gluconolactonase/LRE-like region domain-containing protein n=1 Tax=Pseudomonas turukhanskensis TaxID=1806536 RepID=A0A9W6K2X4_9PSED|nr:hypothetical protein [Pseudomonas turukhanskensis]GLK87892.1 hypothetical protein GCM10017655_09540 [Pseudomonas turukhanskensis]
MDTHSFVVRSPFTAPKKAKSAALALLCSLATTTVMAAPPDMPVIYVAQDSGSNGTYADGTVSILSADPSAPLREIDRYINAPRITADTAGNLYAVSYHAGTLTRYPPGGGGGTVLRRGLLGPTDVVVDRQGGMYIAEDGPFTVSYYPSGDGQPVVVANLRPNRLALDSRGNLYISSAQEGGIFKWDVATSTLAKLVSGLRMPTGLAIDSADQVVFSVADSNDGRGPGIYSYTPGQERLTRLVGGSESSGIAMDESGLYFTWGDGGVYKRFRDESGVKIVNLVSGLNYPRDLVITPSPVLPPPHLRITSPNPQQVEHVATQRPSIQGTGAPGAAVTVSISSGPSEGAITTGSYVCEATVNDYGNWACESTVDLTRGHVFGLQALAWGLDGTSSEATASVSIRR